MHYVNTGSEQRQAIVSTNADFLLIGSRETYLSEIHFKFKSFHSRKCSLQDGDHFVSTSTC